MSEENQAQTYSDKPDAELSVSAMFAAIKVIESKYVLPDTVIICNGEIGKVIRYEEVIQSLQQKLAAAERERDECKKLLKRLEWVNLGHGPLCPICGVYKHTGQGHAPDCEMARLIR